MEWKIFNVAGEEEAFFQEVLLSLAAASASKERSCAGYAREVRPDLVPSLRFLKAPTENRPAWGVLRLYASLGDTPSLALLCGESLQEPLAYLRSQGRGRLLREASVSQEERSWGLIGLSLPGWVILFSEEVDEACRDGLDEGFSVAYLPAKGVSLSLLDPTLPAEEALQLLFFMTLQALPERGEPEGPGTTGLL